MNLNNTPQLSIITINRNDAQGLEKTLESIWKKQSFKDFVHIIIDGASTDNSINIIKKYASHLSYWVSEPDKGIYNAMNKGIIKAKGNYLLFLNSGDWLENDILARVFKENFTDRSHNTRRPHVPDPCVSRREDFRSPAFLSEERV